MPSSFLWSSGYHIKEKRILDKLDESTVKTIDDGDYIIVENLGEFTEEELDEFLTLNALLRTPLNQKHQFIISFNPVSEKHWIRNYFFDENDAYKLNDRFKDNTYLNHSTFKDNEFIDQDAYEATLVQNAYGNLNRMLVDVKG